MIEIVLENEQMHQILFISGILLAVYIVLTFLRLIFSANLPERVVALDAINTMVIVILVVLGAIMKKALYIDIGIVYGILSFIGTLYMSRYLEKKKGL
jgi:multicomponent Na+:H+ antiporter subunit F